MADSVLKRYVHTQFKKEKLKTDIIRLGLVDRGALTHPLAIEVMSKTVIPKNIFGTLQLNVVRIKLRTDPIYKVTPTISAHFILGDDF